MEESARARKIWQRMVAIGCNLNVRGEADDILCQGLFEAAKNRQRNDQCSRTQDNTTCRKEDNNAWKKRVFDDERRRLFSRTARSKIPASNESGVAHIPMLCRNHSVLIDGQMHIGIGPINA